jgi:hypothetical protein
MEHPLTSRAKKRLIAAVVLIILILGVLGAYAGRTALRQRMLARALTPGWPLIPRGLRRRHEAVVGVRRSSPDRRGGHSGTGRLPRNLSMENSKHLIRALSYARLAAEVAPKDTSLSR